MPAAEKKAAEVAAPAPGKKVEEENNELVI
jgi:hypothetical protein